MNLWKQEQELKPETHDPNEEKEWGKPSYLDRLQALDDIIQHTPINERASSVACQEAYAMLKIMHHPKFHICSKCGKQYGNSETRIAKDLSNLYGICPWCGG